MHLTLDLVYNGRHTPHSIVLFYSFTYRALHGFDAARLLGESPAPAVARSFWHAFFGTTEARGAVLDSAQIMRVLVVEDEVPLGEVFRDFLAELGHDAIIVRSAEAALGPSGQRPTPSCSTSTCPG